MELNKVRVTMKDERSIILNTSMNAEQVKKKMIGDYGIEKISITIDGKTFDPRGVKEVTDII